MAGTCRIVKQKPPAKQEKGPEDRPFFPFFFAPCRTSRLYSVKLRLNAACVNNKSVGGFQRVHQKKPRLFKGAASQTGRKYTAGAVNMQPLHDQDWHKGVNNVFSTQAEVQHRLP
jgi:hypothetical protein